MTRQQFLHAVRLARLVAHLLPLVVKHVVFAVKEQIRQRRGALLLDAVWARVVLSSLVRRGTESVQNRYKYTVILRL